MEAIQHLDDCISVLQNVLAFLDTDLDMASFAPVAAATAAAHLQHALDLLHQAQAAKP